MQENSAPRLFSNQGERGGDELVILRLLYRDNSHIDHYKTNKLFIDKTTFYLHLKKLSLDTITKTWISIKLPSNYATRNNSAQGDPELEHAVIIG